VSPSASNRSPLAKRLIRYRSWILAGVHTVLFLIAFFFSFGVWYNFKRFDDWFFASFLPMAPMVVAIKLLAFSAFRLHQGWWRYVGLRDLLAVAAAAYVGTFGFVLAYYVTVNVAYHYYDGLVLFESFPPSVFLIDFFMTVNVVCGARVAIRLYHEQMRPVAAGGPIPCLILGAGNTGEALLREILRMNVERHRVVGFLDDDPAKQNMRIHGVPVLGRLDDVRRIAEEHQVDDLLVAMPEVSQRRLRRVVELCQGTNLHFRTVPAVADVIGGRVTVSQMRPVDINDLLGREQVRLDEAQIKDRIEGQRVLVTGAGGSIGSEICRQLTRFKPARLILVEKAENNLFEIDRELERMAPEIPRVCDVADIQDAARMDVIFARERPHLVFHSAAHKHVPMMEFNVGEAIKNNVVGTRVVADAARRHRVGRFVMISTDKAVNPTSVMGCTKRIAEMYIQQLGDGDPTQFITVRFGNVIGSSGSVVPIFRRQIAAGGPVTVTDPRMTRYFMTIPEASQLVLQAGVMGRHGDIYVLDMGEPVRILDLAKQMITLSGFRPGEDVEIVFTGVRPGEKLFEELKFHGEDISPTPHEQIGVWRNRPENWERVCHGIDELFSMADRLDNDELRSKLATIVPEYNRGHEPEPPSADEREWLNTPAPAVERDSEEALSARRKLSPHAAEE
jgi:FlaA1/EpsC-like NDP-sugar epimerase